MDCEPRQPARLTINFRGDIDNSSGTYSFIKTLGIRVGGNLKLRDVFPRGDLHCMNEEFFTDTGADVFGSNPHMFEFGTLISDN